MTTIDVYTISFCILAGLAALSAIYIFVQRKLVHAVLALMVAFGSSAVLFLLLDQPFIALLQTLVFIGGLSTYLMVSLAAEERGKAYLRMSFFIPLAIVFSAWLCFFAQMSVASATFSATAMSLTFAAALKQYYLLLYIVVVLLFAAVTGSVLFVKKFAKPVT